MHALPLIEVELLGNETEAGLSSLEFGIDTVAENLYLATRLVDERADNSYCSRFTCAVGSEQRVEVTGIDREIDSLECLVAVGIGLGKVFDG